MPGRVQLGILDCLGRADNWTAIELARWVFDCEEPKPHQLSNIVRALRALERQGDVQVSAYRQKGRRCWSKSAQWRPRQNVIRRPRLVAVGG